MAKGGHAHNSNSNHSNNHNHNHNHSSTTQSKATSSSSSSSPLTDEQLQDKAIAIITNSTLDDSLFKTLQSFERHLSQRPEICFITRLDKVLPSFYSQPSTPDATFITLAFILHYPYANHPPHLQPFRQVLIKSKNLLKAILKSKDKDDHHLLAHSLPLILALEALLEGHDALAWLSPRSPADLTRGRFPSAPITLQDSAAALQSNLVRQKMEALEVSKKAASDKAAVEASSAARERSAVPPPSPPQVSLPTEAIESNHTTGSRSPSPQPDVPFSPVSVIPVKAGEASSSLKEMASTAKGNLNSPPDSSNELPTSQDGSNATTLSAPSSISKPLSAAAAAILAARSGGAKAAVVAGGVRRARPRQKTKKSNGASSFAHDHEHDHDAEDHEHEHSDSEASDGSGGAGTCTCCQPPGGPGFHSPESSMKMFQALTGNSPESTGRVRDWFMESLRRFPSHLDDIGVVVLEAEALEAAGVGKEDPVWLDWSLRTARAMNEAALSSRSELTTILNGLPDCPKERNSIKIDVIPSIPEGLFEVEAWNSLGTIKHFRPLMRALFFLFEMHESRISSEFRNVDIGAKRDQPTQANLEAQARLKARRSENFLKEMKKVEVEAQDSVNINSSEGKIKDSSEGKIKEISSKKLPPPKVAPPWARRIPSSSSKIPGIQRRTNHVSDSEEEDEHKTKVVEAVALIALLNEGTKRALSMREQQELRSLSNVALGALQATFSASQVRLLCERNPLIGHEFLSCLCKHSIEADEKLFAVLKSGHTNATQQLVYLLQTASVNLVDYVTPLASLTPSLRTFDLLTRLLGDRTETLFRTEPVEIPEVDPEKRALLGAPAARTTLGALTRTYCLPEFLSRQVDKIEKNKREGDNVEKAIGLLCQFVGSLLTSGLLSVKQRSARALIDAGTSERATAQSRAHEEKVQDEKKLSFAVDGEDQVGKEDLEKSQLEDTDKERKYFFKSAYQAEKNAIEANEEEATAVDIMLAELKGFVLRFSQRQDAAELFRKIVERERDEN